MRRTLLTAMLAWLLLDRATPRLFNRMCGARAWQELQDELSNRRTV